jgi:oligopeptide transport system substrate-binding protein
VRLNHNGENQFTANKNFRLAFNAAFDRTGFMALAGYAGQELNGRICYPGIRGVSGDYGDEYPVEPAATADLTAAEAYLTAALGELGLASASDITLELLVKDNDQNRKEAAIIQDMMLKNLGINITIRSLPNAEWLAEHKAHTYEMIRPLEPDYNDPLTYMAVYVGGSPTTRLLQQPRA